VLGLQRIAMSGSAGPYGRWISQGTPDKEASPQPPPLSQVQLRLFCIPMAGMGGWCFHGWTHGLPQTVEVMPLELPARSTRMAEGLPYATSIQNLACKLLDGLGRNLLEQRPFAFFGHSFGALVAYEVCQELSRRAEADGWPLPQKLYVSGYRAPHLAGTAQDPDKANPCISGLGSHRFWAAFEGRYGVNPDLQADYIREFVEPTLKADFGLLEAYEPNSLKPLAFSLCALSAKGDCRVNTSQLSAWAQCTSTASFEERWFEDVLRPGGWSKEHRYVVDNPSSLLRFLHTNLPIVGCPLEGDCGISGPLASENIPSAGHNDSERGCLLL